MLESGSLNQMSEDIVCNIGINLESQIFESFNTVKHESNDQR